MTSSRRPTAAAVAARGAYSADDRRAILLLMLPVLLVATVISAGQALRPGSRTYEIAAPRPAARQVSPTARLPDATPPERSAVRLEAFTAPALVVALPASAPEILVEAAPVTGPLALPDVAPQASGAADGAEPSGRLILSAVPPEIDPVPGIRPLAPLQPMDATAIAPFPGAAVALAAPVPNLTPEPPAVAPSSAPLGSLPAGICDLVPPKPRPRPVSWTDGRTPAADPARFGADLAAAAQAQTREFVVYNDKYRRISYPMGDVPAFYGVCTDVIIRAYRELGVDLQLLVQTTRTGSGDPNIDHRRVDTLRRFFATHGASLPVTDFAEDYRPGDIVSYWRPQNRHSRTHIAVVSNEIGPSGRPMIVHNRGWGPQLEDALFVDQITGHYRFHGLRNATPAVPAAGPAKGPAVRKAAVDGQAPPHAPSANARSELATVRSGGGGPQSRSPVLRRREAGAALPSAVR